MPPDSRRQFLTLLSTSVGSGAFVKLTLGRPRGADPTLRRLFVDPVALKAGPHLRFVWRHDTRDVTKNHPPAAALALLEPLIGGDFRDAHLFTRGQTAQLESRSEGGFQLRLSAPADISTDTAHDHAKVHPIADGSPWLRALGVTNDQGRPREGMAAKFRQIQKYAELLVTLTGEAGLAGKDGLSVVDMGAGKGYLTFAASAVLGERARVLGVEARPELVEFCNRIAGEQGFAPRLSFAAGAIADTPWEKTDVLIALHACDTATDDALAKGIAAGAALLVVSPCCQKELRPQLTAPPVLAGALQHGIFQERQAEFATDALRALLLEWSGYRTKVFEFVSTEHTPKNLMIAAIKGHPPGDETRAQRIRDFAAFYGIKRQALARQLGFDLVS